MDKLYVHYNGSIGPGMTHVFKNIDSESQLSFIFEQFSRIYNKKYANCKLNADDIILQDSEENIVFFKSSLSTFIETSGNDLLLKDTTGTTVTQYVTSIPYRATLLTALESYSKKRYRDAEISLQDIQIFPEAQCILGDINRKNRKFQEAYYLYTCTLKSKQNLSSDVSTRALIYSAYCSYKLQNFDCAVEEYKRGLISLLSHKENSDHLFKVPALDIVKGYLAEALYAVNSIESKDRAIVILNQLVESNKAQGGGLLLYARIAFDQDRQIDALQTTLRVLVNSPNFEYAKQQIVSMIQEVGILELLKRNVLVPSPDSSPAYAYLATIAKDYSAINEAKILISLAMMHSPCCAAYSLFLAHLFEIQEELSKALECIRTYMNSNLTRDIFKVTCKRLTQQLAEDSDMDVKWIKGYGVVTGGEISISAESELFDDDLDLLGLWLTLVKILFCMGRLRVIPHLIQYIEPIRKGRNLHLTSIRNENAYYCCIAQLLSIHGICKDRSLFSGDRIIYVVGDSHSLPTAWRPITIHGKQYLLCPRVITGIKHWHLRNDSDFYPKLNFYNAIKNIPSSSKVIFILGEIDCREGILVAVEKSRYKTVDEGIKHTVGIFMKALKCVVDEKNINVAVHPVAPVLPATRGVVSKYNAILQKSVEDCSSAKWLNFYCDLLDDNQEKLRPEYELDGTHLHPQYLRRLELALQKIWNDGS